jgi:hypothetical protein
MVMFHSFLYLYQRLATIFCWKFQRLDPTSRRWDCAALVHESLLFRLEQRLGSGGARFFFGMACGKCYNMLQNKAMSYVIING